MEQPIVRRATAADAPAMAACVYAAYDKYIVRLDGNKPGPMLDDYDEVVRDRLAFVLEQDGRVVGVLVLIVGEDRFTLHNVAVHPDFQGQGLGRRLLQLAEEQARQSGFQSITLYTNVVMTENQALYKRIGYVETERVVESGFTRIYMRKDLTRTEETAGAPIP